MNKKFKAGDIVCRAYEAEMYGLSSIWLGIIYGTFGKEYQILWVHCEERRIELQSWRFGDLEESTFSVIS